MKRRRVRAVLAAVILLAAALALAGCSTGDFARLFFHPAGLGGKGTPAFAIVGDVPIRSTGSRSPATLSPT